MDYLKLLQDDFKSYTDEQESPAVSRLEYLSENIFQFFTYDSSTNELFAKKAIEVCQAITNRKTFEYIEDRQQYLWYLMLCHVPFFAKRINWGSSIRGAWWDFDSSDKMKLEECHFCVDQKEIKNPLIFTRQEWTDFMNALYCFAESEMSKLSETQLVTELK